MKTLSQPKRIAIYVICAILGILCAVFLFNTLVTIQPNQEEFKTLKQQHSELVQIERDISKLKKAESMQKSQRDSLDESYKLVVNTLVELGQKRKDLLGEVENTIGIDFKQDREVIKTPETPQRSANELFADVSKEPMLTISKAVNRNHHALVRAIIFHETGNGKTGVGKTQNNLCGIRRNGKFESYETRELSWNDCINTYFKYYSSMSITDMSKKWTATAQEEWKNNVTHFYNKFKHAEI